MAHLALYRKYRPSDFTKVCGQGAVTSVLSYQVKTGKASHAYLFCGSRGTGKTSCAKIMAKAINCLDPQDGNPCGKCEACLAIENETATDVVEMDAASNNGVEYIRDIREEVVYTPAMLKNRVYIIDEVHMLSTSAFNALLKTLEEPPERVVFILATTELHKIPATILSRCQRFDFKRLTASDIAAHLAEIAKEEGISFEDEGLFRIARLAQGGMRDAISMLELCAAGGQTVTAELVQDTAGVSGFDLLFETVRGICHKNYERLFETVEQIFRTSHDPSVFLEDLIGFYRDMLVMRTTKEPEKYLELSSKELTQLKAAAQAFSKETILLHSRMLDDAYVTLSRGIADKRLVLESTLIRLCDDRQNTSPDALLARIAALEAALAGRGPAPVPAAPIESPLSESSPETAVPQAMTPDEEESAAFPAASPSHASDAPAARQAPASPVPDFIEGVKQMERVNISAASILRQAKATFTQSDGILHLSVENNFFRMMLDRDEVKEQIKTCMSALDSIPAGAIRSVAVEVVTGTATTSNSSLPDLPV